jgi:Polyketide cyclase / dehydrase and lipid transport
MTTYISDIHVDVEPVVALDQVVELMMKSFTLLEATPERVGTKYRYEMRLLGRSIGGTCTLTEYVPGERATFQWHGPERFTVGGLRGEWSFTPEDGGTRITIRSIFEPRIPVLHALGARLMIGGFRKLELPAMKKEMEARSKGAQPTS